MNAQAVQEEKAIKLEQRRAVQLMLVMRNARVSHRVTISMASIGKVRKRLLDKQVDQIAA